MLCVKYIKIYLIFSFVFYKSEGMRREVKDDFKKQTSWKKFPCL